ncbi:MAG: cyclase family protein [Actinobacteria bacterium]|nr:cyclase family protein [Actinomycetota bacterium]
MRHDRSPDRAFIQRLGSARIYDLGLPIAMGMPASPQQPYIHALQRRHGDYPRPNGADSATDVITLFLHNSTHLDALGHFSEHGKLHGGLDAATVQQGGRGLKQLGIETVGPVARRGVLLDVAGAEGVDQLPDSFGVTAQCAQDVARAHGIEIGAGDAVLVRTGFIRNWDSPAAFLRVRGDEGRAGVTADCAEWLAARRVYLVGADTVALEHILPVREPPLPVHISLLVRHGVYILEMAYLEELARERVYEFGFVMAPLKLVGATASPVRPLALA